jgi:hypothetical protein
MLGMSHFSSLVPVDFSVSLQPATKRTVWGDPAKFADHQFPFDRSMISKSAKPHESNQQNADHLNQCSSKRKPGLSASRPPISSV